MAATTTTGVGHDLRAARTAAGLTRADVARLAGCSLAALGNIEQGYVPKRSRVLETALEVIAAHDSSTKRGPGGDPDLSKLAVTGDGHGSG